MQKPASEEKVTQLSEKREANGGKGGWKGKKKKLTSCAGKLLRETLGKALTPIRSITKRVRLPQWKKKSVARRGSDEKNFNRGTEGCWSGRRNAVDALGKRHIGEGNKMREKL